MPTKTETWTADAPDPADHTIAIRDARKGSPLAYVQPRPFYNDTQAANARLIAAAPKLRDTVWAILPWFANQHLPVVAEAFALLARIDGQTEPRS